MHIFFPVLLLWLMPSSSVFAANDSYPLLLNPVVYYWELHDSPCLIYFSSTTAFPRKRDGWLEVLGPPHEMAPNGKGRGRYIKASSSI